jgi:hypothetical protein
MSRQSTDMLDRDDMCTGKEGPCAWSCMRGQKQVGNISTGCGGGRIRLRALAQLVPPLKRSIWAVFDLKDCW